MENEMDDFLGMGEKLKIQLPFFQDGKRNGKFRRVQNGKDGKHNVFSIFLFCTLLNFPLFSISFSIRQHLPFFFHLEKSSVLFSSFFPFR